VTRFGVVAYRDDDDPEFLTRVLPLTLSTHKVRRFLDQLEARGGGDIPEAVAAGLRAAIEKPGWRSDSRKIIVIVGDAPPHPEELAATLASARAFRAKGGKVTTVDVSFDANPQIVADRLGKRVEELETVQQRGVMPEFLNIAAAGGGDGSSLEGDRRVVRQLAVVIFGQRWSDDVRPLLGDL
jgi:Mg-chelatase subunit ChlD